MKKISILGSTGSIGKQTLDLIRNKKDEYKVVALSANTNTELLYNQILEFKPDYVVIMNEKNIKNLSSYFAILI